MPAESVTVPPAASYYQGEPSQPARGGGGPVKVPSRPGRSTPDWHVRRAHTGAGQVLSTEPKRRRRQLAPRPATAREGSAVTAQQHERSAVPRSITLIPAPGRPRIVRRSADAPIPGEVVRIGIMASMLLEEARQLPLDEPGPNSDSVTFTPGAWYGPCLVAGAGRPSDGGRSALPGWATTAYGEPEAQLGRGVVTPAARVRGGG
jgi:hypothetical protein